MGITQDEPEPETVRSGDRSALVSGRAIDATGKLRDARLEAQFRSESLRSDVGLARGALWIAIVAFALFGWNDFQFFGADWPLFLLWATRGAVIAASAWTLWRLARPIAPAEFDRDVFAWHLLTTAATVAVTATRPPEYAGHAIVNLGAVLATYCVIPLPLARQALSAMLLSAGAAILALWIRPLADRSFAVAIAGALVSANAVGLIVSRQMRARARTQFLNGLERAAEAGRAAAPHFGNRGGRRIAPICAFCRRVRTDSGAWESVETLFRDRTHAELSRSVCPDCERSVVLRSAPDPIR